MAYTLDTTTINKHYNVNTTFLDYLGEKVRKSSYLYNAGAAGNIQSAMQVVESCANAGISAASASIAVVVSGANATPASTGQNFPTVKNVLILGFTRAHPLNSAKTVKAFFGIPSPVNAIVDTTTGSVGKPVMTRGIDFATAAGVNEALGALVDWLEDALTFTDVTGSITNGGWTFSNALSGLITNAGIIDENPLT